MNKSVKLKIWTSLCLMVIFFVPFPTAFTQTVDQEAEPPVKLLPDSSIEITTLEFLIFDKEVELSFHLLPVNPDDETNFEVRLVDKETSSVIQLTEPDSNLPCNWEWWMFKTRNCDSTPPETDEDASGDDGDASSEKEVASDDDGNASSNDGDTLSDETDESSDDGVEISKFMVASSDYICRGNCEDRTIQSYRKVCVSYDPDPEDSQTLKAHVWFKHGCTNCYPLRKEEEETSWLRVESSLLPIVTANPKKNSIGWLNGDVRSFGLLNLGAKTHAKPTTNIHGDIDSTVLRYGDVQSSVVSLFEVFNSDP